MSLHLQVRLKNCLQTILDLEVDMEKYSLYENFKIEMTALKGYLKEVDAISLCEADVHRLEQATALFLQELSLPHVQEHSASHSKRVLQ